MAKATVFFATNRDVSGPDAAPIFSKSLSREGSAFIRYGKATIDVPADGAPDKFAFRSAMAFPETLEPPEGQAKILGSTTAYDELRTRMAQDNSDAVILIHGFSCTFPAAAEHAASLAAAYGPPGKPLIACLFSWPADGDMVPELSYYRDEADAKASGDAIARAMLKLFDFLSKLDRELMCKRRLHLVAHSMGNYALRQALQAMVAMYPGKTLPRMFDNIFLMAADEDADAFDVPLKLARLPELAAAVHVYYAGSDRALLISDKTKGHPDRLGTTGPRTLTDLPLKLTLVDCGDVADTGSLTDARHQYYRKRPEVVTDVAAVLAGKRPDTMKWRKYVPDKRSWRIKPA